MLLPRCASALSLASPGRWHTFTGPSRCLFGWSAALDSCTTSDRSARRSGAGSLSFVSALLRLPSSCITALPPSPNNALQRTEAGGRLFSVVRVLRRQPPSLSLGPLGTASAWLYFRVTRFGISPDGAVLLERAGRCGFRSACARFWAIGSNGHSHPPTSSPRRAAAKGRREDFCFGTLGFHLQRGRA